MQIKHLIHKTNFTTEEGIFLIQQYLKDIGKEDIPVIKLLMHPHAEQLFEINKNIKMNSESFFTNPQIGFSTIRDFFSFCINESINYFLKNLDEQIYRVSDKNGNFIFQYT